MSVINLSLVNKLRLAFLAVPILLIITITIYSGFNLVKQKNYIKASVATQVAKGVVEKIDRNFYERFGDVQAFAANRLAIEMAHTNSVSVQSQKFINTMVSYYVLYDLMMVVNTEGKVVACNTVNKDGKHIEISSLLGENFSRESWFTSCMSATGPQGGAWYSDFHANAYVADICNNKGWGMSFAAPIRDDNNQTVGVWYNFASWKEVTQGIRQEALQSLQVSEPGSEILLLNEYGQVIDATADNLILNEAIQADSLTHQVADVPALNSIMNGKKTLSGLAYSAGAYTYKGKNWRCLTLIPEASLSVAYFFTKELLCIDVVFLFIALLVSNIISKNIVSRVHQLRDVVHTLSKGDLRNIRLQVQGKDELSHMGEAVLTLISGLKQTSAFAEEVGKGNFSASFTPLSEADMLGNALIQMNHNLKIAAEEDKRRNWTAEGLARFSEIIRSTTDIHMLSDKLIANLVKYLQANQGGLFIISEEQEHNKYLELAACYAFDRKKFIQKKVSPGEGLLGQAYLEKDTIYLTQVPDNYVRITSGLGDGNPRSLLIVPLKSQNTVEGLLEIASFREMQPYEIAFVEKLAETIASTIASVKVNERTRTLLEEAQIQSEQMRAQEEEMRQNMEELIATQEEMQRKEAEYLAMLNKSTQQAG